GDSKAHFLRPDSYQVTWWPGDRAQEEIQSDSTTDDHLLITGLRPSTAYTIVVEARKMEKYTDFDEGV
ncbi:fibronectin, partial [Elysia marginata]